MSRVTRSKSQTTATDETSSPSTPSKRSAEQEASSTSKKARKPPSKAIPITPIPAPHVQTAGLTSPSTIVPVHDSEHIIIRPKLSFDYNAAKNHLIDADARFEALMRDLECKPFVEETDLNPFRALCSSILGQQISWLAARSITHKFIRLVAFPDLPEKVPPTGMTTSFPTPSQVASAPMATLRAAGLSQRKAEYVQDLAARFHDGRLSAAKLVDMSDEEVMDALIQVRGIGKWTVEMFMIFTLRRPNVLPCGDLGVQKGLVRWWTQVNPSVHAKKLPGVGVDPTEGSTTAGNGNASISGLPSSQPAVTASNGNDPQDGQRQVTPEPAGEGDTDQEDYFKTPTQSLASEVDPSPTRTPKNGTRPDELSTPDGSTKIDVPLFTPRSEKIAKLPPFPESKSLTRESCKARLNKKIKGNIYLSPTEMEELTEAWKPYRSIGVWYLWSLADADTSM